MSQPITVTLPHSLGRAEAHRRIAGSVDKLAGYLPGPATVASRWEGERLNLDIGAMGQKVAGTIDVEETQVRVTVTLPPMLALFGEKIAGFLRGKGTELLEDKSRR